MKTPNLTSNKDWLLMQLTAVTRSDHLTACVYISTKNSFCYKQLKQQSVRNVVSILRCCQDYSIIECTALFPFSSVSKDCSWQIYTLNSQLPHWFCRKLISPKHSQSVSMTKYILQTKHTLEKIINYKIINMTFQYLAINMLNETSNPI
jgi:hypothetical protein